MCPLQTLALARHEQLQQLHRGDFARRISLHAPFSFPCAPLLTETKEKNVFDFHEFSPANTTKKKKKKNPPQKTFCVLLDLEQQLPLNFYL